MKAFFRAGSFVFAGLIASNVLTYVYYATVSHAVGVSAVGLFMSLISAILIAALPASGATYVIAKIAADAVGRGEIRVVSALGRYTAFLTIPVLAAGAIVGALFASSLNGFFHAADSFLIFCAVIAFALTIVVFLQRAVLQGAGRFTAYVISNGIEAVVKAIVGVACLVYHVGLRASLGGYVVATAAAAGFNIASSLRGPAPIRPQLPRAIALRHVIGIALPTAALAAVTFADVVIARHVLSSYQSGLYGATSLYGRALLTALVFVPTVLMPQAAAEHAAGRSPRRLLLAAGAVTAVGCATALVLASVIPGFILTVIAGRSFVAGASLVLPYTAAMSALVGATVLATYLIALNRTGFAVPLVVLAAAEIVGITVYHPDPLGVIYVVLIGHSALFVCCLIDALLSLRENANQTAVSVRPDRR